MTAEEFDQAIMVRGRRKPFQAYRIELTNGERIDIDRPHSVAIRNGIATCFAGGKIHLEVRSEQVKLVCDIPIGANRV